ncbi:DNA cytosine methyltransferase [Streptomyces globosus]|uniref:DNA cytosine methyltransferase n=1 Tax=Streptomyces globosus TaxID=68209 RepID=UPI00362F873B
MTSKQPPVPQNEQIRVMDLFAGAGGFSAGFASYEPKVGGNPFVSVAAVELDRAAASTYAANFGRAHVYAGDIATFDATQFKGEVDVIMGGPRARASRASERRTRRIPETSCGRNTSRSWRRFIPSFSSSKTSTGS